MRAQQGQRQVVSSYILDIVIGNCDLWKVLCSRLAVCERPNVVLNAEEELGITAGLQDRVVQVYGGVVYMDFDKDHMQTWGHGRCPALLATGASLRLLSYQSCSLAFMRIVLFHYIQSCVPCLVR
jgi:hypothetical protein